MVITLAGRRENFSNQIKHYPETEISAEKKGFISSIKRDYPQPDKRRWLSVFLTSNFHHTIPTQVYRHQARDHGFSSNQNIKGEPRCAVQLLKGIVRKN